MTPDLMSSRHIGTLVPAGLVASALLLLAGCAPAPVGDATAGRPLSEPPLLEDTHPADDVVEFSLTASAQQRNLVPGAASEAWVYNGSFPGPTLDVKEGDSVVVRLHNDLDEPTTIHWHGLHLPYHADGSPFHPVEPGETYTYAFRIPEGTAGTYWYHPHPD